MKFFLQDCQTMKFMRCDSTWTVDVTEALDFLSERRAFFWGMKELKHSFQILKIAVEDFLTVIPRLTIPTDRARAIRPTRAAYRMDEQSLPLQKCQPYADRFSDNAPLGELFQHGLASQEINFPTLKLDSKHILL
jgi:hypothetical protein